MIAKKDIPTLRVIAGMLNISVSTVSKALNNHYSIGLTTKEKVQKLAKELNYTPNQAAIHFKQKKSYTIGVILPNLSDQLYSRTITGLEDYLMAKNYNVFICQSHESLNREKELVSIMQKNRVDGVIITITKDTTSFEHLKMLEEWNIPVVYLIRNPGDMECYSVNSNVFTGAVDAVNFLVKRGHKRIAHIKGPDMLITSNERHQGYIQGIQSNHLKLDQSLIKTTDLDKKSTQEAVKQLLQLDDPPTAILTFKDAMALDAIQLIRNLELKPNKEIEFIGFGNSHVFEYLDTAPLASVEQQPYQIGAKAADMLFRLMTDANIEINNLVLECDLVLLKR